MVVPSAVVTGEVAMAEVMVGTKEEKKAAALVVLWIDVPQFTESAKAFLLEHDCADDCLGRTIARRSDGGGVI